MLRNINQGHARTTIIIVQAFPRNITQKVPILYVSPVLQDETRWCSVEWLFFS